MTEPGTGWSSPGGAPGGGWGSPTPEVAAPSGYGVQPPTAPVAGWAPSWSSAPGVVPLRPLGIGELLDGAVKIMRRSPGPAYGASAAISAVITIVNVIIVLLFVHIPDVNEGTTSLGDAFNQGASNSASSLPEYLLLTLGGLLLTGVLVTVVSRALLGQNSSGADLSEGYRPRLRSLIGVTLLATALMWGPFLLTLVAAALTGGVGALLFLFSLPAFFYFWVRGSLMPSVLILERSTIRGAYRRSGVLVKGSFWHCTGVLLLGFLISVVLRSILSIPLVLILAIVSKGHLNTGELVATQVMGGLAQMIVGPFFAGTRALLYIDQRMRLEGLDVALQSAAATRSPVTAR